MSSPLKWFRKHEKLLLGVFGVMLMIVFTISFGSGVDPIVDSLSGQGAMRADSALVSFKGGELTFADAYNLRRSRFLLQPLLATMQYRALQQNKRPMAKALPVGETSDEGLLQLVLLSKEAERLGIQISDDSVLNYLKQFSADTVPPNEVLKLWKQVTSGEGTERQLLNLLRRELMAQHVVAMSESGAWPISPVRGWDFFNQMERYVSAEFLPIPVADFVKQVPEPSEAEVRKIYDEFKDKYRIPGSPDPGFKRRLRRAFDYVKLDYGDFLKAEKQKISDEQVRKYYEENREEFRETLPSSDLELDEQLDSPPAEDADATKSDTKVEPQPEAKPVDSSQTPSSAADDKTNAAADESSPSSPADDTGAGNTSPDDKPASGNAKPEEPSAPPAASGQPPDGQSANASESGSAGDAPSLTPIPQEDQKTPAEEDAPATNIEAEVDSNSTLADQAESDAGDSTQPADAAGSDDKKGSADSDEEPTYRSLEEVAESIRESLAAPLAQKSMDKTLSQLQAQMDRYYRKFSLWQADQRNSKTPQPELSDLSTITSAAPIEVLSQPLCDELECDAHELGQAYDFEITQQYYRQIPFAEVAYKNNMSLYQPILFPTGEAATKFVYWVTAEEAAYVPALKDIRDEVVQAWKTREARELALAAAEEQAAKAREKSAPLGETLAAPDRRFFNTGEVTWMSTGSVGVASGAMPRPAEIPGVAMAGDEFRRTMFRLAEGEVGVAFDAPKSTVYVIRINKTSPDAKQLAEMLFNDDSHATAFQYLQESSRYRLRSGWYQDLLKKYDVTWLHDPNRQDNG